MTVVKRLLVVAMLSGVGQPPMAGEEPRTIFSGPPGLKSPAAVSGQKQATLTPAPAEADQPPAPIDDPSTAFLLPPLAPDRDTMLNSVLPAMAPLTPDEIRAYMQQMDAKIDAAADTRPPPKMVSRTIQIDLTPGAAIPSITIAPGQVSTLVLVDKAGNPWPITSHTLGNPKKFQIAVPDIDPHNLVTLAALSQNGNSSVVLTLEGLAVPIMASLKIDRGRMDARADLQVSAFGPVSTASGVDRSFGAVPLTAQATDDANMSAILDGVPPDNAKPIPVDSTLFRVYDVDGVMYVRTTADSIQSGQCSAIVQGAAGVKVCRFDRSVPLILYVHGGSMQMLKIKARAS
jgi:hypothetical protein